MGLGEYVQVFRGMFVKLGIIGKESSAFSGLQICSPSIDASYQVSVHLAEGFQRRRLKCEKLTDDK